MFKIDNLSFSYNTNEKELKNNIENINLKIKKGEVVLLCGESGCGKTTITRCLNGLIPYFFNGRKTGEAYINGKKISEMPIYKLAENIGSVFQDPKTQFFNVDTTSEIIFGCENLSMPENELKKRLKTVAEEFKLYKLLDKSIFKISGGEKQKIACASVNAVYPDAFILDEPSSNLDSESSWNLKDIIQKWKEDGKTVVIAEHKLFFLEDVLDRVIFFKNGKIESEWDIGDFKKINHRKLGLRQLNLHNLEVNHKDYYSKNQEFLELKNFTFKYDKSPILDIKHAQIPKNEIIAIIGKNGAGKSTFAHCLCGLERSCKGELILDNKTLKRKDRLKKSYMVMQDVNHQLFTESVIDEVLLSMDDEDEELAEDILRNLNLIHLRDAHPMALSGGEKQRVAIASAIASKKEILIFDEPTSGLDLKNMMDVSKNLIYLQKLGITSFIITHDYELILETCTHILHFDNGRIIDNYKIDEEKLKKFFIK